MKRTIGWVALFLTIGLWLQPGCAPAGDQDTIKEVVKLLKADVGESVVLAYIAKEGAPAKVDADAIVDLKKAGATEAVILALMGGAAASGAGTPPPVVGPPKPEGGFPFELDGQHTVLKPVVCGAMAVYPILRKGPVDLREYVTLDEAMGQKLITIREKGDGSVPIVIVINTGKLPIYICAGEIIIGGKQDRMVAYDVILHPGKELSIDVRCVEHGRWQGGRTEFRSAGAMGGLKTKRAVQFAGQADVWHEVAAQNAQVEAESSTDSYRAAIEKPELDRIYRDYAGVVLPALSDRLTVGMVVAVNGKMHSIDLFGGPGLFGKLKEKLLKGYVMDTIGLRDEGRPAPAPAEIRSFYATTMAAQAAELKNYEANSNTQRRAPGAAASECADDAGVMIRRGLLAE